MTYVEVVETSFGASGEAGEEASYTSRSVAEAVMEASASCGDIYGICACTVSMYYYIVKYH